MCITHPIQKKHIDTNQLRGDIGEEPFEFSAQSFEGAAKVTNITLIRESGATTAPDES